MSTRVLSPRQIAVAFAAASRTAEHVRDTGIVAICLDAGPHRSELVAAKRGDLDAARGLLTLGSGATRRTIRLGPTALAAVLAAAPDERSSPLLQSSAGRPLTERAVHEQLLTIGSLAGLGHWVTARHLRRTFIATAARRYPLPVSMRLSGHGSHKFPPASVQDAVKCQFVPGWTSVLEELLGQAARRHAA
jgi:integrase